jgi:phage replication O-like protein O
MRSKADTEDGYLRLATDLNQAMARAHLTPNEFSVCLWVIGHTYGVQLLSAGKLVALKFTAYSVRDMGRDLGRNPGALSRTIKALASGRRRILVTNKDGLVGINTRISEWGRGLVRGRTWQIGGVAAQQQGPKVLPPSNTRKKRVAAGKAPKLERARDNDMRGVAAQQQGPKVLPPSNTLAARPLRREKRGGVAAQQQKEEQSVATQQQRNISREYKRDREREQLTRAAGQAQEYRAETPIQKVVCAYKVAKGIPWDDREWDTGNKGSNYSRAAAASKEILKAFDQQVKPAAEFVVAFGERMGKAGRSWTLETAARWAWDEKGERAGANQDTGGNS